MDAELIFSICGKLVLPAWLLLVLAPKWLWTERIVHYVWIPSIIAVFYIYSLYTGFPSPEGGGFGSLKEVMVLFQHPYTALAGWVHYLAFDLFIGAWEVRDAQRRGVNHLLVIPCLILTFMAGPVGLLLYFIVRLVKYRSLSAVET